jgi:hypothetical protein
MLSSMVRHVRRLVVEHTNDAGQALLLVLIAVALLMSIPLAIATTTVDQLPQTSRNLNWDAAYEAAQAGLNDYLQRLDLNGGYGVYNKSNNTSPANTAFSGWVSASTTPAESYSYAPTVVPASGLISLEVSGKAGTGADQVVRTFDYSVRPSTSLDDVYWSNYETVDPALGSSSSCAAYYSSSSSPPSSCVIEFDSNDTLDGPVFSNDTFRMCGSPTFKSTVESGNPNVTAGYVQAPSCSGGDTPVFDDGSPTLVANTPPQSSIPSADVTAALNDGCEFTGNVTLALSQYPTTTPTTTKIAWSGGTLASGSQSWCGSGSSGTITVSSMTAGLIYAAGNITVSGAMTGGLDLMSNNNISITGNITYPTGNIVTASNGTQSDATDALGLVAENLISLSPPNTSGMTIDAAILSLTDSFYLPSWTSAPNDGTLTVFGSIAQDFRGPVGTATSSGTVSTGFAKNYHYDTSLQTLWPPYFVPPYSASWGATTYSECVPGLASSVQGTKTVC